MILHIFPRGEGATREEVPMTVLTLQPTDHRFERMHAHHEELVERIGRVMLADGTIQALPGLYLSRASVPLQLVHSVLEPSVCVIAQGSKEVLLGESRYRYDPSRYLLATVELPR